MLVAFIEPEMVLIAILFASAMTLAFLGTMLGLIKVRVDPGSNSTLSSLRDGFKHIISTTIHNGYRCET